MKWRRLPPVAAPVSLAAVRRGLASATRPARALEQLTRYVKDTFDVKGVHFLCSGRAALTIALRAAHQVSGRRRVIVPAYTCFSVAASVVRARLDLVPCDVVPATLDFDFDRLETLVAESPPLCVVPTHLFGVPAQMKRVRDICTPRGVFVIEDAAQAFGFTGPDGWLGTSGDVGVFSFARGKAISACGGGALITNSEALDRAIGRECSALRRPGLLRGLGVLLEALAASAFVHPSLYWIPSSLPFIGLGETRYSTDFPIRQLSSAQVGLLLDFRRQTETMNDARTERLRSLGSIPGLLAPGGDRICLRLPLLCPSRQHRDRLIAIGRREGLGFTAMYPSPITRIPELEHLLPPGGFPGAEAIADRLLTVPVHPLVSAADIAAIGDALCRVAREG